MPETAFELFLLPSFILDRVMYNLTLTVIIPGGNYNESLNEGVAFKNELIEKVCCETSLYVSIIIPYI